MRLDETLLDEKEKLHSKSFRSNKSKFGTALLFVKENESYRPVTLQK